MAGDNDFNFRIGIDSSDFEGGLKEVQRKLTAAMAQFEREKSLIKIRADIDIAGLDETTDKTKILEIQERALSDTLDIQRQKLQVAAEAYELISASQGQQAASSQKLELAMEKERLKVVQLEKDLEKLKQAGLDIDAKVKVDVDDSEIDNIKIDAPKVDIKADVDISKVEAGISKAEQSIKSKIDRLSRQQALIQLRGQVKLEGLDEAAGDTEKLRLQEEALSAQIELQEEKISLLSKAYEDLARSQGESSDAAQIAAINLEKEQLAMARLQQQTEDLSKQTEIAIGVEWELLGLIEPAIKGIDALIAAGRTIPIPHAKAAAAAAIALSAVVVGSKEATEELRENNPAQILSDSFSDVETDIAESFAEITDHAMATSQEIDRTFTETAENVESDLETMGGEYADYLDDALSIIQILVTETDNLGDSLEVVNSQLPYMKTETGRIAAIALGIQKTLDEMSKAILEFTQPAVDGFREVSKQANELYLSLSKAQELVGFIDLAGGDYDDVRDYVRGVQDAVIKGGADDPEVLALEKYGVVIQDTKGKLLEFDEALENLYQGYVKAKEAGEAEAYIIMTNGQSIHDVAGFLENYGKAKEKANQIAWSTSDFDSLAELSNNLKMAEVQTNEFNNALSTLGVPLANLAAESNFEFFKMATELVEKNRDTILLWEFAAIEAFKSGKQAVIDFANSAVEEIKKLNEIFGITDKFKGLIDSVDESLGLTEKLENLLSAPEDKSEKKDTIFDKAKKDLDEYNAANEKAREITKKNAKDAEGLSYSLNRIAKYKEEIADLKIDLQFGDDEYQKSLAKLEQWRQTALRDARQYEEEQKVIAEEYALKRELIELQHFEEIEKARQESLDRAKNLMREAADIEYENTHSAFEKQLRDIEQWKQAQLEKASTAEEVAATIANAAMKEADAFEKEVDRMRGKIESAQDRLARLTMSQRDNDIYQAQKQYYQDLQDLPKEFADAIYNAEIAAIKKREKGDKSGSYTERPNSAPNDDTYYQLLDYTKTNKQLDDHTKRLVMLDAEEEARAETLKESRAGIEDIDRTVQKAQIPLMGLTGELSKTESAAEKTIQQLQDTADTTQELGGTLENADSAVDKNAREIKNATSAVGTFSKALNKSAKIQAQNAEEIPRLPQPEDQADTGDRIKVHFGDDPIYGKNRIQNGVKILYGDDMSEPINLDESDEIPALYGKFANLGDATEKLTADINSANVDSLEGVNSAAETTAQNLTANVNSFESVNNAAEKVAENLAQLGNIDLQKSIADLQAAMTPSAEKLTAFDTALDNVTDSLQKAAEKINGMNFQAPQAPTTPAEKQTAGIDVTDKALDATQTAGKITSLIGTVLSAATLFGGPASLAVRGLQFALAGGATEILADIAQQIHNFDSSVRDTDTPKTDISSTKQDIEFLEKELQTINQSLSPLKNIDKTLETIAQDLKSFDPLKNMTADVPDKGPVITPLAAESNNPPAQDFSPLQVNLDSFNSALDNSRLIIAEFSFALQDSVNKLNTLEFNSAAPTAAIDYNGVLASMTQELISLTQTAGAIAQSVSAIQQQRQQPPVINVNPNISIDLGGAYVFDDRLKAQLTDDIATEVADAITDAVSTATSGADYGYGN